MIGLFRMGLGAFLLPLFVIAFINPAVTDRERLLIIAFGLLLAVDVAEDLALGRERR